jgi:hypothetical protein
VCNENLSEEQRWKTPTDLNAWGSTIKDFDKLVKIDKKTNLAIIKNNNDVINFHEACVRSKKSQQTVKKMDEKY